MKTNAFSSVPTTTMSTHINISYKGEITTYHMCPDDCIDKLKSIIEAKWDIPHENQKLIGIPKKLLDENATIAACKFKKGHKIILVGSTRKEIEKVLTPAITTTLETPPEIEKWESQEKHKKIIQKGLFESGTIGIMDSSESLPEDKTITHVRNLFGNKTRMTFKYDHIAFNTDTGTSTLPYDDILEISSQPLSEYPGYSIVYFRTKGNFLSKDLYVYFVPDQYVGAIKMYDIKNMLIPEFLQNLLNTHTVYKF